MAANDILLACSIGDLSWLRGGLAHGQDPKATDKEGFNSLHLSAKNGQFDCLLYLLNNCGIDINTCSREKKVTPLHCSVLCKNGQKNYQCMKLLLERGADYSIKDCNGQSVLHYAVQDGHTKCLKLLLEYGVSIDEQDNDGKTAFGLACISSNHECARLLRALHWAHDKDKSQNERVRKDQTQKKKEEEARAARARLKAEKAQLSYTNWMKERHLSPKGTPKATEKRKESRSKSCSTCTSTSKHQSSVIASQPMTVLPIKLNSHQEQRNLESIGKPYKLHPYTNSAPLIKSHRHKKSSRNKDTPSRLSQSRTVYRARSRGSTSTSSSASSSASASVSISKSSKSISTLVSAPTIELSCDEEDVGIDSVVDPVKSEDITYATSPPPYQVPSHAVGSENSHSNTLLLSEQDIQKNKDCEEAEDNLDEDCDSWNELDLVQNDREDEDELVLPYPDYDYSGATDDNSESSLFHDVGDYNNLDSLSLPTVLTKGRTQAELLQLLCRLGNSEDHNSRKHRRSNSFSHNSNRSFSAHFTRRLSLGSIPEGRIVTDYVNEEDDEESTVSSQLLKDLENAINSITGTEEQDSPREHTQEMFKNPENDVVEDIVAHGEERVDSPQQNGYQCATYPSPSIHDQVMDGESDALASAHSMDEIAPSTTLNIVNLAWDVHSKSVQTHVLKTSLPPRNITPPSRKITPPSKKITHPSRKITPPSKKITSPSRKITPPPQKITPPSRKFTPPSKKITPPSRKITPPSIKITPPSRKITPPPQKITPPSRKITPPSRKISPQSQPVQKSDSDPCLASPTRDNDKLFFIEESEDIAEHELHHSLFSSSMQSSLSSKSMVLDSSVTNPTMSTRSNGNFEPVQSVEGRAVHIRSASAPDILRPNPAHQSQLIRTTILKFDGSLYYSDKSE